METTQYPLTDDGLPSPTATYRSLVGDRNPDHDHLRLPAYNQGHARAYIPQTDGKLCRPLVLWAEKYTKQPIRVRIDSGGSGQSN